MASRLGSESCVDQEVRGRMRKQKGEDKGSRGKEQSTFLQQGCGFTSLSQGPELHDMTASWWPGAGSHLPACMVQAGKRKVNSNSFGILIHCLPRGPAELSMFYFTKHTHTHHQGSPPPAFHKRKEIFNTAKRGRTTSAQRCVLFIASI